MSVSGQLDFSGGEQIDPRIEKAAKALYLRDVMRRHQMNSCDAADVARDVWPQVEKHYLEAARTVLGAAGVI